MNAQIEILKCGILSKRKTYIPATFIYPTGELPCPLVIAAHGFQSSRHEYGLYDEMAVRMAEQGIAVMLFDFPGNNDSEEPMTAYTLTDSLDDMESAFAYAVKHRNVDGERIGILGWSMGGCMAALFSQKHPEICAMALWVPVVCPIDMIDWLEGEKSHPYNFESAMSIGQCIINKGGCNCELSGTFLLELLCANPYTALNQYCGSLFLAAGLRDSVLNAAHIQLGALCAVNSKSVVTCYFEEGDHDFGTAYGNGEGNPEITQRLLTQTSEFFLSTFQLL